MLQSMGSQRVGHDLVTEQHSIFCLQVNYGSSLPSSSGSYSPFHPRTSGWDSVLGTNFRVSVFEFCSHFLH